MLGKKTAFQNVLFHWTNKKKKFPKLCGSFCAKQKLQNDSILNKTKHNDKKWITMKTKQVKCSKCRNYIKKNTEILKEKQSKVILDQNIKDNLKKIWMHVQHLINCLTIISLLSFNDFSLFMTFYILGVSIILIYPSREYPNHFIYIATSTVAKLLHSTSKININNRTQRHENTWNTWKTWESLDAHDELKPEE